MPDSPSHNAEPRAASVEELGELLDTVQAGIEAAQAHLVMLSASLDRIAEELRRQEGGPPAS